MRPIISRSANKSRLLLLPIALLLCMIGLPGGRALAAHRSTSPIGAARIRIVDSTARSGRLQTVVLIAKASRGARCRLALSFGHGVLATGAFKRVGASGELEFLWHFAAGAREGTWVATVRCRGQARGAQARIALYGAASGRVQGNLKITIRTFAVSTKTPPIITEPPSAGAKGGSGYPAYGLPILAGSAWFGGHGVTVYSDGGSGADGKWQCVELFERFNETQGWIPGLVGGGDAGAIDLFSDARLNAYFVGHPNGSGYIPVPGDAIIFSHGQYGHVAIVDSVEAGLVNIVEQNASATGRTTLSISGSRLGNDGVEVPVGVLHPIKDARTPASSTPAPVPSPAPAPTSSGIVFPVQNTDETPPDGVYFRYRWCGGVQRRERQAHLLRLGRCGRSIPGRAVV
jgi:hypothetical protein